MCVRSIIQDRAAVCRLQQQQRCMQTTADQGQSDTNLLVLCHLYHCLLPICWKRSCFWRYRKLRTTVQGAIDIIDGDAYFVLTDVPQELSVMTLSALQKNFKIRGIPYIRSRRRALSETAISAMKRFGRR